MGSISLDFAAISKLIGEIRVVDVIHTVKIIIRAKIKPIMHFLLSNNRLMTVKARITIVAGNEIKVENNK